MTTHTKSEVPVTDTYEDVKNLLYHVCHKFERQFGIDFEELLSEAHVAFMAAYSSFDPGIGEFSTLLVTCVRNRLLDLVWKEKKRTILSLDQECGDGTPLCSLIEDTKKEFDLEGYLEQFSDDAQYVLRSILDHESKVSCKAVEKGGQPRNWRSSCKDHLREICWTHSRISDVFKEIKVVVGCEE